ncbi:hypothetical protein Ancab_000997 [Ancistrocladus abbreviatus]
MGAVAAAGLEPSPESGTASNIEPARVPKDPTPPAPRPNKITHYFFRSPPPVLPSPPPPLFK